MRLTTVLAVIAGLLIAAVVALVVVLKSIDLAEHRDLIAEAVREATGRELVLAGDVELAVSMTPTVIIGDVSFANAEWGSRPLMLAARRIELQIDLLPLLVGKINVSRLILVEPEVMIETDAQGRGNWEFGSPADATGGDIVVPSIGELVITGGRLTYRDGRKGETTEMTLRRLSARADGVSGPLDISVAGGFADIPFTVEGTLGSIAELTNDEPYPVDLRGEAVGAKIAVKGDIRRALAGEGFDFTIDARGDTLGSLSPVIGRELPDLGPYVARLRLTDPDGRLAVSDIAAEVGTRGETFIAVAGGIRDVLAATGLDLRLDAESRDTATLAAIAGVEVPSLGAVVLSARLTDPDGRLAVSDIAVELGTRGETFIAVAGGIRDVLAFAGLDLRLDAEARDTAALAEIAGVEVPSLGAVVLSARLTDPDGTYRFDEARATIGDSDLSGKIVVDLAGDRPLIEAELVSSRLDVDTLLGFAADPSAGADPAGDDVRVFSDDPLPFDALGAIDGRLSFHGERIAFGGTAVESLVLDAALKSGLLRLDLRKAVYGTGQLSAKLTADARQSEPQLTANIVADGFDLGRLLSETGVTDLIEGKADLALDLRGTGPSTGAIMAGLNGRFGLIMGEGSVGSGYVDLLAADLVQAIAPWSASGDDTKVNCLVSRFDVADGLATSEALLFDTQRMTVVGKGTINLASEQLDLIFKPKPKDPSLLSLATPIRLGGSLASPHASPDSLAVAKKAAGVVLGAIATGGIGLIVPFISLGSGDDNPCVAALAVTSPDAPDQSQEDEAAEGLSGVLKGVGGAISDFLGGD